MAFNNLHFSRHLCCSLGWNYSASQHNDSDIRYDSQQHITQRCQFWIIPKRQDDMEHADVLAKLDRRDQLPDESGRENVRDISKSCVEHCSQSRLTIIRNSGD